MKIYTKTGDDGTTALFSGGRVAKTDIRVEAYGTVDEINSILGVVLAHQPDAAEWLITLQNQLFQLGADLATPLDAKSEWIVRMDQAGIDWLEARIDEMTAELEPLKQFILPGGCLAAAHLQVARTVCRRAERITAAAQAETAINPLTLIYLNRLSDFLFTVARWENLKAGVEEPKWQSR